MEDNNKPQNVEFEKIEINVTAGSQVINFSHTTEIDHTRIIGIAQVFTNENAVPNSTLELDVDGQRVFPDGFESKLIYAGQEVPPDDKYFSYLDRPVKQIKVTGKFTDGNALAPFAAYSANIYLMVLTTHEND